MDRCKRLVLVVLLAACGSVDEDRPGDPDAGGSGGDAPPGTIDGGGDQPDAGGDGPPALGPWGAPTKITSLSVPTYIDSYPAISADGKELFFISNRMGGYQVWVSRRFQTTDAWGVPSVVAALSDPLVSESGVELSDDGTTIFFARYIDADWQLYTSTRTSPDAWTTPAPLTELNTVATERSPHVTADSKSLYFVRGDVAGNLDIHLATRTTTTAPWEYRHPVTRLNSSEDEDSVATMANDLEIYIDSRRDGTLTTYKSTRPPGGGAWSFPEAVAELAGGYRADVTPDGRIMVLSLQDPVDGQSDLYEARR